MNSFCFCVLKPAVGSQQLSRVCHGIESGTLLEDLACLFLFVSVFGFRHFDSLA